MSNLPSAIQDLINNASITFNGKVPWGDTDAVKDILTDINENTAIYGILTVGLFADLPTYVYGETPVVACVIYDGDATKNGLYIYDGGWTIKAYFNFGKYEQTVGDGSTKTFHINHGLDSDYPAVDVYEIGGSFPVLYTDYTNIIVTAIDANAITVYFPTAAPNVNSKRVIVRK